MEAKDQQFRTGNDLPRDQEMMGCPILVPPDFWEGQGGDFDFELS